MSGKMAKALRGDENIKRVWTMDGKNFCVMDERGQKVKKVINTPEDLLKVGWTEEKANELKLYAEF